MDTAIPDGSILLEAGSAQDGSLAAGEIRYYHFPVEGGTSYAIKWNDQDQGDGTKTCDIKVSAYRNNILGTAFFTDIDKGWTDPRIVSLLDSGYVILTVTGYSAGSNGTFAIEHY
jgi:hypothetical protein